MFQGTEEFGKGPEALKRAFQKIEASAIPYTPTCGEYYLVRTLQYGWDEILDQFIRPTDDAQLGNTLTFWVLWGLRDGTWRQISTTFRTGRTIRNVLGPNLEMFTKIVILEGHCLPGLESPEWAMGSRTDPLYNVLFAAR